MAEEYIIEKTVTTKYRVANISPFLKYDIFCEGRKGLSNTPKTCFRCGRKFNNDDITWIGIMKQGKNKIFCAQCGKHINSILTDNF